jgi:hypothetical protein
MSPELQNRVPADLSDFCRLDNVQPMPEAGRQTCVANCDRRGTLRERCVTGILDSKPVVEYKVH